MVRLLRRANAMTSWNQRKLYIMPWAQGPPWPGNLVVRGASGSVASRAMTTRRVEQSGTNWLRSAAQRRTQERDRERERGKERAVGETTRERAAYRGGPP